MDISNCSIIKLRKKKTKTKTNNLSPLSTFLSIIDEVGGAFPVHAHELCHKFCEKKLIKTRMIFC